jgi:hypothetical protein
MIVKICKIHGDLTKENVYQYNRIDRPKIKIILLCKLCTKEKRKLFYQKNKIYLTKIKRDDRRLNREKYKEREHKRREKHRERRKILEKKCARRNIEQLGNYIVRQYLAQKYKVKPKDIGDWMLPIYRSIVQLKRAMKKKRINDS